MNISDIYDLQSFARDRYKAYPNRPRFETGSIELTAPELQAVALFEAAILLLRKNGFEITGGTRPALLEPTLVDVYRNY